MQAGTPDLAADLDAEGEGEEADLDESLRPTLAMDCTAGVKLLPRVPAPSVDALVAAFDEDAHRSGCRPYGRADRLRLRRSLEQSASMAQALQLQPANRATVEKGNAGAHQLVSRFRVERVPWSTAGLGGAQNVNHITSWVLGANPDTTRTRAEIGSSAFSAQDGPYVKDVDGSVVPTLDTVKLEHAMLAPEPSSPNHTSVRTRDLVFATPFDTNERVRGSRIYEDPSKDKGLVDECAPYSVLPGLLSPTSWAELADGDAQLGALQRLVDAGHIECIWRAGPSLLRLFDKVPGEVELTPNPRGKQLFGLLFLVLPEPPAVGAPPPDLLTPPTEPTPAPFPMPPPQQQPSSSPTPAGHRHCRSHPPPLRRQQPPRLCSASGWLSLPLIRSSRAPMPNRPQRCRVVRRSGRCWGRAHSRTGWSRVHTALRL